MACLPVFHTVKDNGKIVIFRVELVGRRLQLQPFVADHTLFPTYLYPDFPFFVGCAAHDPQFLFRIDDDGIPHVELESMAALLRNISFGKDALGGLGEFPFRRAFQKTGVRRGSRICRTVPVRLLKSPLEHMTGQAQPTGNIQGTAFASFADFQLIEGLKAFPVKGHAGIQQVLSLIHIYKYLSAYREYKRGCSLDDLRYVMHGGGEVGGRYQVSNSLEALQEASRSQNRIVELDFSWTTDNQLVCLHNWGGAYPPKSTLNGFLQAKIYGALTPMGMESLSSWLRAHPEVQIVADFKERSVEGLRLISTYYPDLLGQFIPYLYHTSDYEAIHNLGYRCV